MSAPHPALLELAAARPLPPLRSAELDALLASAVEHRVSGLLWTRVAAGELALPPAQAALLAKLDLHQRSHHRRLWATLQDVTARLAQAGVSVISFKGVTAEARWYSRLGERPCNDVDLVLAPDSLNRVRDVVELLQPNHFLKNSAQRLMTHGVLQSIDLDVAGVEVDMHADLMKVEIPTRHQQPLFDASVQVVGPDGIRVRALSPEHALVHFLLHLNKDGFGRLLGYADVARLLSAESVDWDEVDRFVRGEGLQVHVYSALHEVTHRLGLPPAPVPLPHGVRATAWRVLWPERDRLVGRLSLVQRRHRRLAIPWTAEGRLVEAAAWWIRRRVLPPKPLVDLYYGDTQGPYLSRLVTGRWHTARHNRALSREVEGASPAAPPVELYKTFPPKWAHIQVPLSSPQVARAALALYSPCRRGGYAGRDVTWLAVGALGPRAIPGRARPLTLPVPPHQWEALLWHWQDDLGSFGDLALHSRPQKHRSGFSVLLLKDDATPLAFVRVRRGPLERFTREQAVLDLCTQAGVTTFWHPRTLATGLVGDWSYLAMSAFPPERHVACGVLDEDVLAELEQCLQGLPRPEGTPSHWTPMHGDLTPWNYRELRDGRRALVDWEDAAWGPPGADDVLFRATVAALRGTPPGPGPAEAVAFWRERLVTRTTRPGESIGRPTVAALDGMGAP